MQTVWSRIAQTTASCCCPSCKASTSGIARRAATATARRPTRYLTTSTLFYSGIFAAAATHDAGAKKKRREQWDQAIAQVKHGLGQEGTRAAIEPSVDEVQALNKEELGAGLAEVTTAWTPLAQIPEPDEIEAMFADVRLRSKTPVWPESTGASPVRHNLPPQSIYAGEQSKAKAASQRWTPKKVRTMELSIDKFILWILIHLDFLNLREQAFQDVPGPFKTDALATRRQLLKLSAETRAKQSAMWEVDPSATFDSLRDHEPVFTRYRQDNKGHFHHTARELDTALKVLFQRCRDGQIDYSSLLAKICYNLTASSAPPSLACYNTLLIGLRQAWMQANVPDSQLVERIIISMHESHVRMNELSMATILTHYRESNNRQRFLSFVERMNGLGRGLALARRDIHITPASQGRLVRVITDATTGAHKIVQKPHPTPTVFEALVRGVLHFSGFDSALRVCHAMGHEGWGLTMRGLTPLLADCVARADWAAGAAVWAQIRRVEARGRRLGRGERVAVQTYAAMLRLCCACDQREAYCDVFDEALKGSHSQARLLELMARRDGVGGRHEGHDVAAHHHESRDDGQDAKVEDVQEEALSLEQLSGHLPGSAFLDEYEAVERPMALRG